MELTTVKLWRTNPRAIAAQNQYEMREGFIYTGEEATFVRLDQVIELVEAAAEPFHKSAHNPEHSFDVSTVSANAAAALDHIATQLKEANQ